MAKSLDQFLAETGRQSILDQLGRAGQLDKARSEFAAGRGQFTQTQSPQVNFDDAVKRALELQQQANQPAVSSLQASIPEIQQGFSQQREQITAEQAPLQERYKNLLADIKQQGKVREEAQTRVTSGELGKRGIVGSSTLAQQEIQQAVDPIRADVMGATRDIGLSREDSMRALQNQLANLLPQETEQVRAVQNAIAQLQAGGSREAIQTALQQVQLAQQASQFGQSQGLAREQLGQQASQFASSQDLAKQQLSARGKEDTGIDALQFISLMQSGVDLSGSNVQQLLAQGKTQEAINLALNP